MRALWWVEGQSKGPALSVPEILISVFVTEFFQFGAPIHNPESIWLLKQGEGIEEDHDEHLRWFSGELMESLKDLLSIRVLNQGGILKVWGCIFFRIQKLRLYPEVTWTPALPGMIPERWSQSSPQISLYIIYSRPKLNKTNRKIGGTRVIPHFPQNKTVSFTNFCFQRYIRSYFQECLIFPRRRTPYTFIVKWK